MIVCDAFSMASPAELLSLIDTAITQLLTGNVSSYSIGSRTVTKLDLADLFEQRRNLEQQVARSTGGGVFSLAKIGRRS